MRLPRPPFAIAILLAGCTRGGPADGRFHGVVEIQEVLVASKIGGRVAETPAAEGAVLEAGAVIARFDVPEVEARRDAAAARLRSEEAALERARAGARPEEKAEARAAVEAAAARLARARAGARVEEVTFAKSELEAAAADLAFTEKEFTRNETLAAEKTIARTEFDAARAARDRARGRHAAAKSSLDMLLAGPRVEDVAVAAADLARAEAAETLLLAGTRKEDLAAAEARAAMARSDLALVEADLREAVVVAPEKCVLEVLSVRRGDVLAPRAPVARLHRASDLWVKVFVPETGIGKVRVGQAAEATVDSFPGRTFAGKVSWIGAQAEFTPRNVQSADERRHQVFAVRVVVADPEGVFKSGMAAEVVLGSE